MEKIKVSTLFLILFFMAVLGAILTNTLSLYYDTTQAAAREFMWYYLPHDEEEQPEPMEKASYLKDYDVIYVGSPDKKVIYLTFDDCPENGNIPSLLDILEEHHAPAAFFMTEIFIKKHPDVIRRIVRDGYLVCNHTANHVGVTRLSFEKFEAEIKGVEDAFRETTGKELAKYFRPPQGKFNETSLSYAEALGYTTVFWSFRYVDWEVNNQPSEDAAYNTIMKETHPGEVVLLHCQSKTNVRVLDRVLDSWEQQGYTFGSIDDINKEQVLSPQLLLCLLAPPYLKYSLY